MNTDPTLDPTTANMRERFRRKQGLSPAEILDELQQDQIERWRRRERVPAETYLTLLTEFGEGTEENALDLIHGEFLVRRELGESPSLAEFRGRFPQYADRIDLLFDLEDRLVNETDPPATAAITKPGTVAAAPTATVDHSTQTPSTRSSTDDTLPQIPGYEIEGEIARGGMGRILAARDLTLERPVAIKVLLCSAPDDARRFVVEAKITARLPHPAIPPVHQLGTLPDGQPFLAMKLIRGRTLATELAEIDRIASLPRLVQVFERIAQAVGFAHSQGVIHRDLKPGNVMVGAFGEVQVMDWGLAKAGIGNPESGIGENTDRDRLAANQRGASDLTVAGSVMGTPAFMAPEQARGEAVGPPADVFALGGILCNILTGYPPFRSPGIQGTLTLARAGDVSGAFTRLDSSGADAELIGLCRRLLSPNAADRPPDGKAVADEVAAYRARVEQRLRRAEAERAAAEARIVEQRKRRRVQMALAGTVVAIAGLVGLGAWWQDRQAEQRKLEQAEADTRHARSEAARLTAEAEAERQQREGRERLVRNRAAAVNLLDQVESALRSASAGRASEAIEEAGKRVAEDGTDDLGGRLTRCRTELAMLQELDRTDDAYWFVSGGKRADWNSIEKRYRRAFATYGITAETPPALAAQKINESFIRERLLMALELWFVSEGRDEKLGPILSAADPDEFRKLARRTRYHYAAMVWVMGFRLQPGSQPVWFAIAHGQDTLVPQPARAELLLTAHRSRPDNVPLLMALGLLAAFEDRDSAQWAAGWFRAALAVQPRNAAVWNNLGSALWAGKENAEAAAAFRQGVQIDPKAARLRNNLAGVLRELGDRTGALAQCEEAVRLDPEYADAHSNLGGILRELGDVKGAITACNEAIRLAPGKAWPLNSLGSVLKESGDLPGAIAAYRRAIKLDPEYAIAHANLAVALRATGDLQGSIAACKVAIRLDPKSSVARNNLGNALRDAGDLPGAVAMFREAVRLEPTDASSHSNLGAALNALGDLPGAAAACREAIRLAPRMAAPRTNLAAVLSASGDLPGAVEAIREAVRLEPRSAEAHYNLGSILSAMGNLPDAIAAYREAIRLRPHDPAAYNNLGLALRDSGDLPGAVAACKEAVRLDPKSPVPHNTLASVLRAKNDLDGAIAAYEDAVKLDPRNAIFRTNLASVYGMSKRHAQAITAAREAIRLNPNIPNAHAILGIALRDSGDFAAGRVAFAEAVRLDPKRFEALFRQLFTLETAPPPRELRQ